MRTKTNIKAGNSVWGG